MSAKRPHRFPLHRVKRVASRRSGINIVEHEIVFEKVWRLFLDALRLGLRMHDLKLRRLAHLALQFLASARDRKHLVVKKLLDAKSYFHIPPAIASLT